MPRKQCRGWVEIYLIVENETGRKGGEDGRGGRKGRKKNGNDTGSWELLFPFLSFAPCSPQPLSLTHPLLHSCQRTSRLARHTCFLSTACFNLRSAGVRVGGDADWGGDGRVLYPGEAGRGETVKSGDREEKRERTALCGVVGKRSRVRSGH